MDDGTPQLEPPPMSPRHHDRAGGARFRLHPLELRHGGDDGPARTCTRCHQVGVFGAFQLLGIRPAA